MKKKILAFVLLAALLLNALPVYAANAPTFRVDSVTAEAGDTVEVTIWIDNNPGLASAKLVTIYDPNLTLTAVEYNSALGGVSQPPQNYNNPVILNWLNFMANANGDMYYAKLTFAVAEDAAAGTYPITVTYDPEDVYNIDYDNISFEVVNGGVTIEGEELPVAVTGVALDKESLSLIEGESAQLTATVSPADAADKSVVFESEDPTVATVDNTGKVTAVKTGTTTIIVNTVDGYFTATCVVSVGCAHGSLSVAEAKAPDCQSDGWDAYKTCNGCGQLFDAEGKEISQVPFRPATGVHTGGTATCTRLAVCDTCGTEYGALALHDYSAQVKSEVTMTEAGTCADEAVYCYSCAVCGDLDNHTFKGDKDPDNHTGGTSLVGKIEADHKNQVDGYTGDEVCNGCGAVLSAGTAIPAGAHTAGNVWGKDQTGHWKTCTVDGCGIEMDFAAHTPDHEGGATEEYAVKCTECGYVIEEQLAHTHVFDKEVATDAYKVSDATCENKAVYNKSCACGEKGTETFEFGEALGHKWQDATCEYPQTCSRCLETRGEPDGHNWEDATCLRPKTCARCLKTEGEALGHKWIDATCDTAKTCETCGRSEGEALGHKWADATCTTAKTCETCGKTEGEALGHTPDRAEPTEENAVKCTVCGEILKPALDHTHKNELVEAKDATCEEDGNKAYYVCKCGMWFADSTANVEIADKNSVVIEKLGHKWVDATCETAKTCETCGKTEGEALGHKWAEATCTTAKTCETCGKTEGEALGHTPDREEATEENAVKCTVCGETLKPALDHTHKTELVEAKDATCEEDGNKAYYACKCGMWFADSTANVEITDKNSVVIEKLGHKWVDATCETAKTCETCGKTEGEALGHKWADATCDSPKTCETCGKTEGEKLEHKWVDATCTEPKTCKLCGLTDGEALGHGEVELKSDKTSHWDACSVCGEKLSEKTLAHEDNDGDEKCDVCDYVLVKPGTPQTGDNTLYVLAFAMLLSLMGGSVILLNKKRRA